MLVERTINQLQINPGCPQRAKELGQLGYMQWLGGLHGSADYQAEAVRAYLAARPLMETAPSIAIFCDLLRTSLEKPLQPLDLALPKPQRRGGARSRRLSL